LPTSALAVVSVVSLAITAPHGADGASGGGCPSGAGEAFGVTTSKGACSTELTVAGSATGPQAAVQSVDASGKVAQQPRRFQFTNAVVARDLRWRSWKDDGAFAKGKVGGVFPEPRKARLYLSRPSACDAGTLYLEARLKVRGGVDEKRNYDCFC
jgi:hypothetical protein